MLGRPEERGDLRQAKMQAEDRFPDWNGGSQSLDVTRSESLRHNVDLRPRIGALNIVSRLRSKAQPYLNAPAASASRS